MPEKTVPHNIDAEQSVLGSMFLTKKALQKSLEGLISEDFYLDSHQKIFEAIKTVSDEGKAVDHTTVIEELTKRNWLQQVGGIEYIVEMINSVPTTANIDDYINIVSEKSLLRKLIDEATSIVKESYNVKDIGDFLFTAQKKIADVSQGLKTAEFKAIQDVLVKTQSDLEKLATKKGDITGIPTGFYDFDKITSGFHPNQLLIIAARPGMGKTAFALNMATNIAIQSKKSVAIFNMEMGAEQLITRMIAAEGQIPQGRLRNGTLHKNDWKKMDEAIERLVDTKIYIDDTPGMTIAEIRAKCRRLASTNNDLGVIIIDYLQLINGTAKYAGNRQQEISEISRSLKTLAMELEIPVIALAQLSRSVEQRENKRPIMSDLRESGSIEQDADIVSFLYREDYYSKEKEVNTNTSVSEFIIAKHRNGPTATVELLFKRDTSTFLSYKNDKEAEFSE
jgi:replicative DNA helicase